MEPDTNPTSVADAAPATTEAPVSSTPESSSPSSETTPSIPESTDSSDNWLDRMEQVFGETEEPDNSSEKTTEEKATESETDKSSEETSKTEATDESEEVEPKDMSVEARRAFKEYRVKNRELSKQLESLQTEIQTLKSAPKQEVDPAVRTAIEEENKQLKSQLEQLNQELTSTAVEATQEYQQQVIRPYADTLKTASVLAERYNVSKRLLERAIEESAETGAPTEELVDAASAMSGFDQQEVHLLVRSMRTIMQNKAWFRENSADLSKKREQQKEQQQAYQVAERVRQSDEASKEVWSKFKNLGVIKSIAEPDLKKAHDTAMSSVLSLEKAPADLRAYAVFAGALMPEILKQVRASETKVKELEASLAKYTKAKPRAGGGTADAPNTGLSENVSFLDAIEASLR